MNFLLIPSRMIAYKNMKEPMLLCRICEQRIPIRLEKEHTTICVQYNEKLKQIEHIDLQLLTIANQITAQMKHTDKKM